MRYSMTSYIKLFYFYDILLYNNDEGFTFDTYTIGHANISES